jgi:hypothetical protein
MTSPQVPADDQTHRLAAELGLNSRGEPATVATMSFTCPQCATEYEFDIATALPRGNIVIDMADGQATAHAGQLAALADSLQASGAWGTAQRLRDLAASWITP